MECVEESWTLRPGVWVALLGPVSLWTASPAKRLEPAEAALELDWVTVPLSSTKGTCWVDVALFSLVAFS